MNSSTPNIFECGTKELSQDAFFTWLLKWASSAHQNNPMHQPGLTFLRLLMNDYSYECWKVSTSNQWQNTDIVATINEKDFILIEDKLDSGEHGSQLSKYANKAIALCKKRKLNYPNLIYLKTGNDHKSGLKVSDSRYTEIRRSTILNLLNQFSNIENDIFQDFLKYLNKLEETTFHGYTNTTTLRKNLNASTGLFTELANHFKDKDYHWDIWRKKFPLFRYTNTKFEGFRLKIFVDPQKSPGLFVKITTDNPSLEESKFICKSLKALSPQELKTSWRKGSKEGKEAIICQVDNAFHPTDESKLDLKYLIRNMEMLEQTILKFKEVSMSPA